MFAAQAQHDVPLLRVRASLVADAGNGVAVIVNLQKLRVCICLQLPRCISAQNKKRTKKS